IPQSKVAKQRIGMQILPESLHNVLGELYGWTKLKEETSRPVKETAMKLLNAQSDDEAAQLLGILYNNCINYLNINDNKWFKSSARKKTVRNILDQIANFTKDARSGYLDQLNKQIQSTKDYYDEGADVRRYIEGFEEKVNKKISNGKDAPDISKEIENRRKDEISKEEAEDALWSRLGGLGELLLSGDIKEAKDRAKEVEKSPMELGKKKYYGDGGNEQMLSDLTEAVSYISNFTDIKNMPRNKLLISQDELKRVKLLRKEIDAFCTKYKLALSDEEKKTVDDYDAASESIEEFMNEYTELVSSPAFISLLQKGFRISEGDSVVPVMTIRELRAQKRVCETKEELSAYEHLENLTSKWYSINGVDAGNVEEVNNDYITAVSRAKNMSEEELNREQEKYTLMYEQNVQFLHDKARKIKGTIGGGRERTTYENIFAKLNMVYDNNPEESASLYSSLVKSVEKVPQKQKDKRDQLIREKAEAMEKVFGVVSSMDISDFTIKKGEKYYGKLDRRYVKLSFAMDVEKLLDEYDNLKKLEDFPENVKLSLDEAGRAALLAKLGTLKEMARRFGMKPADDLDIDAAEISEGYEVERLGKTGDAQAAGEMAQRATERMDEKLSDRLKENDNLLAVGMRELEREQSDEEKKLSKNNLKIKRKETLTREEKLRNEKRLTANVNSYTDARIAFRNRISIDLKKKTDYAGFEKLSDFAMFSGGEEMLKKLIPAYAEGQRNKAKRKRMSPYGGNGSDLDREGFAVLDIMTSELMKVNTGAIDIATDEAIARNSYDLEKLSKAVSAYHSFLEKNGGDNYFKYLSEKSEKGSDMGELMRRQLDKLTSLTQYYRVRKLLIEDEGYIDEENIHEMITAPQKKDSFEKKRLRKLLAHSKEISKVLKQAHRDKDYEPKAYSEISVYESSVKKLENERYSVAPKWLQNAFSLTELKDKNTDPNAANCCTLVNGSYINIYAREESKRRGNKKLFDYFMNDQKNQMVSRTLGSSPVFHYGDEKYLENFSMSDSWARVNIHATSPLRYRQTDMEAKEMWKYLKMQGTHEWQDIKDDPEAVAFYESAFKEMSMKFISSVYANVRRLVNSCGYKFLLMHPIDLNMQMTTQLRTEIMGANVASNIDLTSNRPAVEKLFADNNSFNNYDFDAKDFWILSGISDKMAFKSTNTGQGIGNLLKNPDLIKENLKKKTTNEELLKTVFGDEDVMEKNAEEHDKYNQKKDADPDMKDILDDMYYVVNHPEIYSTDTYLKKTKKGEFIFGYSLQECTSATYTDTSLADMADFMELEGLNKLDDEEIANYEKTLKDRKFPKNFMPEDPYGINSYKQGYKNLMKKDEKGNPVMKKGKIQYKSLPAGDFDPVTGEKYEDD
ncbi:MAG: hypothetical protein J6N76_06010, partial [Lachnospiraceae bacterium]|nr:hypothetical protein [Lachnospiraceae bacterium]